ncbi:MAG TPA: YitT family protein [Oscillospiraceae bacterium]|nr:YitT family protein [Oscillospiraceae bacterium]
MTLKKGKPLNMFLDVIFFITGSLFEAVSVNVFTAPNHIAPGGVTGLSTVLNYLWGTPIGVMIFLINLPIFICAIVEIGYKLVTKTIVATIICSVAIDVIGMFLPAYKGDEMLAAIFGGVLEGIGLSLVFMRGGTTGGTDLIARLLGRHFQHISMGKLMLCVDVLIVAVSAIVYKSMESALYALIVIFVSTKLIDTILYGVNIGTGKMLFIISECNQQIAQDILTDLDRGVTILKSKGAYSGRESEVLLCAVRRYEVHKVHDIVHSIDKNAFIIVGDAGEITGEGFHEIKPEDKTLKDIILKVKK